MTDQNTLQEAINMAWPSISLTSILRPGVGPKTLTSAGRHSHNRAPSAVLDSIYHRE